MGCGSSTDVPTDAELHPVVAPEAGHVHTKEHGEPLGIAERRRSSSRGPLTSRSRSSSSIATPKNPSSSNPLASHRRRPPVAPSDEGSHNMEEPVALVELAHVAADEANSHSQLSYDAFISPAVGGENHSSQQGEGGLGSLNAAVDSMHVAGGSVVHNWRDRDTDDESMMPEVGGNSAMSDLAMNGSTVVTPAGSSSTAGAPSLPVPRRSFREKVADVNLPLPLETERLLSSGGENSQQEFFGGRSTGSTVESQSIPRVPDLLENEDVVSCYLDVPRDSLTKSLALIKSPPSTKNGMSGEMDLERSLASEGRADIKIDMSVGAFFLVRAYAGRGQRIKVFKEGTAQNYYDNGGGIPEASFLSSGSQSAAQSGLKARMDTLMGELRKHDQQFNATGKHDTSCVTGNGHLYFPPNDPEALPVPLNHIPELDTDLVQEQCANHHCALLATYINAKLAAFSQTLQRTESVIRKNNWHQLSVEAKMLAEDASRSGFTQLAAVAHMIESCSSDVALLQAMRRRFALPQVQPDLFAAFVDLQVVLDAMTKRKPRAPAGEHSVGLTSTTMFGDSTSDRSAMQASSRSMLHDDNSVRGRSSSAADSVLQWSAGKENRQQFRGFDLNGSNDGPYGQSGGHSGNAQSGSLTLNVMQAYDISAHTSTIIQIGELQVNSLRQQQRDSITTPSPVVPDKFSSAVLPQESIGSRLAVGLRNAAEMRHRLQQLTNMLSFWARYSYLVAHMIVARMQRTTPNQ